MATMKTCRVCGKPYEACKSPNHFSNVFRWQDVACSPECGAEYLRRIQASRGKAAAPSVEEAKTVEEPVSHVTERQRKKAYKAQRNGYVMDEPQADDQPVEESMSEEVPDEDPMEESIDEETVSEEAEN